MEAHSREGEDDQHSEDLDRLMDLTTIERLADEIRLRVTAARMLPVMESYSPVPWHNLRPSAQIQWCEIAAAATEALTPCP